MNRLQSIQDLDVFLENFSDSHFKLIFKHSTRCPLSASRKLKFDQALERLGFQDHGVAYNFVIEDRSVSNEIANRFGIDHQSPQLLIIKDKMVVHDSSHFNIDVEETLKKLSA